MAVTKTYQQVILPNVLYAVKKRGGVSGLGDQIAPSIEVIGTATGIYGAQNQPTTPPTGMFQTKSNFTGIEPFAVIPTFLYVTGSPTSIVLTGVEAVAVA